MGRSDGWNELLEFGSLKENKENIEENFSTKSKTLKFKFDSWLESYTIETYSPVYMTSGFHGIRSMLWQTAG